MKKKVFALVLALGMMINLCACSGGTASSAGTASKSSATSSATASSNYKIGIMTTTVTQSEESYRVAERLKNEYPDKVVMVTFPDNFTSEQETTISTAMSLASNPDIKAIVFSQAVQGTAAACQKIRESRPDILLICSAFLDSTATTAANCDIFYHENVPKMGTQIVDEMNALGVTTFVHYSFPRHLAWQPTADRLQNMKDEAAKKGCKVVEVTTPDPTTDAGVSGTQQFVLEDVPREVQKYGTKIAFFGTNTAQQEPMIKQVVATKSYFCYPSDPSPFVGYASALGLSIPSNKAYDKDYYVSAIKTKLSQLGMSKHMGCWTAPVMTLFMTGGFQYAEAFCEGKTNGKKLDESTFKSCMEKAAGSTVDIQHVVDGGKTYQNGYYLMCDYEVY